MHLKGRCAVRFLPPLVPLVYRCARCGGRFYTHAQATDFGSLSADFARWDQSHGRSLLVQIS